jgi:hypothetical protein
MQTQRLRALEKATAHLPRTLEQLTRTLDAMPESEHQPWLATISDAELTLLTDEYARQRKAAGIPDYDWDKLSNEEVERVLNGDLTPLETCPFLTADNQPQRATL